MNGYFVLYPFELPASLKEKTVIASSLENSFGLELAEDVNSDEDIPPYDVAIRDGWAIATSDKTHHLIQKDVVNGESLTKLNPLSTCWINTGGFLPARADAVIVEDEPLTKEFGQNAYPLENVLPRGSEWNKGDLILRKGTVLGASEQALLFEAGISQVKVYKRPSVAILSTGHEISETGSDVSQGRHSSNATYLSNLLNAIGLTDTAIFFSKDSVASIASNIASLSEYFDFIITVGGTGQGRSDVLRKALKLCKADLGPDKTKLSSSLPFVHGKVKKAVLIGLPGNPLGFICLAQRLVLMQVWNSFISAPFPFTQKNVYMGFEFSGKPGDICVQLASFNGKTIALPLMKGSGRSAAFRDAQAIICNPYGLKLEANSIVQAELFFNGRI